MIQETVSYAQNREDIILAGFFDPEENGFYVDVGANEPERDSVTKLFYDRGWHGINIEPLDQHYQQLVEERPRDINLHMGAGDKSGELVLREYTAGTGLSTISKHMQKAYLEHNNPAAAEFVDHKIPVEPLAKIFKQQKVTAISFMKVDVEGFEYEVLAGNDWKLYRPEVICIEANHVEKDWHGLLKSNGYVLGFSDGLNEYHVDKNKPERLERFSYVDAVVQKEPIVTHRLLPKIEGYDHLKRHSQELEQELATKNRRIEELERTLGEITPLSRHLRKAAKRYVGAADRKMISMLSPRSQYRPEQVRPQEDLLIAARQADKANFKRYNEKGKKPVALSVYMLGRQGGRRVVSKLKKRKA